MKQRPWRNAFSGLLLVTCAPLFLIWPRHTSLTKDGTTHSRMGHPTSTNHQKGPMVMLMGQNNGNNSSTEGHSSQVTLTCVKNTKVNQKKIDFQ